MTYVLRRISQPKLWDAWREKGSTKPFPTQLLSEFMPPVEDKGRLSCYLAENRDQARKIAAAHIMMSGGFSQLLFAGTTLAALTEVGLTLEVAPGETTVPIADQAHRNLVLNTQEKLLQAFELFAAQGGDISFEKRTLRATLVELVRSGDCDFVSAAKAKSDLGIKIWRAAGALVGERDLSVHAPALEATLAEVEDTP